MSTYAILTEAAQWFVSQRAQVEDYLRGRGITAETTERFGLGYAPDAWDVLTKHLTGQGFTVQQIEAAGLARQSENGRVYDFFRHRLMIPIRNAAGDVIAFGGRAMGDDDAKYINTPETDTFRKSETVYALDLAADAIRESKTAVIVEGYMDAIQAHQQGYTNVVACMGTAVTQAVFQKLVALGAERVVLALDADDAGEKATERSIEALVESCACTGGRRAKGKILRVLRIPRGKDPDDFLRETPQEWGRLVVGATSAGRWLTNRAIQNLPLNCDVIPAEQAVRRVAPWMTHNDCALIGAALCGASYFGLPMEMQQKWHVLIQDMREQILREDRCDCTVSGADAWVTYYQQQLVDASRWYGNRDPQAAKRTVSLLARLNRWQGHQERTVAQWIALSRECDHAWETYTAARHRWQHPDAAARQDLRTLATRIVFREAEGAGEAELQSLTDEYILRWVRLHLGWERRRSGEQVQLWQGSVLVGAGADIYAALSKALEKANHEPGMIDREIEHPV